MDINYLLRFLKEMTKPHEGLPRTRRILRFQKKSDYAAFIKEWQRRIKPSADRRMRRIPIIRGISCPLAACELPARLAGFCRLEDDPLVSVHGAAPASPLSDKEKGIPWGVTRIKAPSAWNRTTGHRVKIGVIDTGVDFNHPDLRQSLSRGINLIYRNMLPFDDNGHGTHIAGTIAAANRMQGMIGVAPRSIVHPVKAFDHNGTAFVSDIILGIEWCVLNRMDIINMSFGMKNRSKALLTAVNNAYNAGVIIVASSGNDGKLGTIDYPARFPQTVSVGATNKLGRVAAFTNRGKHIDIYAPGDKILSAWPQGKYHEMSGTSMATSHVSGAIALLLARKPGLRPEQIKAVLQKSMVPLKGRRAPRKAGELNVPRMMKAAESLKL